MRDITVNDILKMLLAHIKLIVVLSVALALGAYIYADNFIPKTYTAVTRVWVKTDISASSSNVLENGKVSSSNITASATLANNVAILFSNAEEFKDITPSGCYIAFACENESNVIKITVNGPDSNVCAETANNIRNQANDVFQLYYTGGEVMPINRPAQGGGSHTSPDATRYALFGFIIGLVISILISIIIEIVDTTIKPDDDLYKMYDIPVFAEIVDFDSEGGVKKK